MCIRDRGSSAGPHRAGAPWAPPLRGAAPRALTPRRRVGAPRCTRRPMAAASPMAGAPMAGAPRTWAHLGWGSDGCCSSGCGPSC
eukprot:5558127-Pyramimonas_sp.AAC.1